MTNQNQDDSTIHKVNKELFIQVKSGWYSDTQIKKLVETQGADVSFIDDTGSTVLHELVKRSINPENTFGFMNAEGIMKYLIDKGANIEAQDQDGFTPLQKAITIGHYKMAEYLIDKGANIEVQDQDGLTPLQQAIIAKDREGNYWLVQSLLSQGADYNTTDHKGSTPLHKAAFFKNWDAVSRIISLGADVDAKDNQGSTPLHELAKRSEDGYYNIFNLLVYKKEAKIDESDNEGFTPLMRTAQGGNADMMNALLYLGANVKATNNKGENILDIAAKNAGTTFISQLLRQNIEELSMPSDSQHLFKLLLANKEDIIHPPKALSNLNLIQKAYENLPDNDWYKQDLLKEIETQQSILLKEMDKYKVYEFYLNQPRQEESADLERPKPVYKQKVGLPEFRLWEEDIARFQESIDLSIDKAREDSSSQSIAFPVPDQATFSPFALLSFLRPAVSWLISKINAPHSIAEVWNEEDVDTPNIGEENPNENKIES